MAQFSLSNLRFPLDTEDQADQPVSEELLQQLRENIEILFMLLSDTGVSGACTEDPPDDNTGVLTDGGSPAIFTVDEHNGRTLLITSGTAENTTYTIDDTTTTTLVCTGDNLYSAGVRSGDTYKVLYDVKVNTDGHNHDGINSPELENASINQTQLKTTTGSVSQGSGWAHKTLPGGEYGFYPQLKMAGGSGAFRAYLLSNDDYDTSNSDTSTGTYTTLIALHASTDDTIYAQQRYVQASGEVHWMFVLRNKISKEIWSMWQAPDHPCFGNGGKPQLMPHPFNNYDTEKYEILVINPSKEQVKIIREATIVESETEPNKDFLDTILEIYDIDETQEADWPEEEVTVGLPPDWNEAWNSGSPVKPIKKVIPRPSDIVCRSLKRKY